MTERRPDFLEMKLGEAGIFMVAEKDLTSNCKINRELLSMC